MQYLTYGMRPTQAGTDFFKDLKARGIPEDKLLTLEELKTDYYWRYCIPVIYRPLNASVYEQVHKYDVPKDHIITIPYSPPLSSCYQLLLHRNVDICLDIEDLATLWVSVAERGIKKEKALQEEHEETEKAREKEAQNMLLEKAREEIKLMRADEEAEGGRVGALKARLLEIKEETKVALEQKLKEMVVTVWRKKMKKEAKKERLEKNDRVAQDLAEKFDTLALRQGGDTD